MLERAVPLACCLPVGTTYRGLEKVCIGTTYQHVSATWHIRYTYHVCACTSQVLSKDLRTVRALVEDVVMQLGAAGGALRPGALHDTATAMEAIHET